MPELKFYDFCSHCGKETLVYREGRRAKFYPFCFWCGRELDLSEDDRDRFMERAVNYEGA